MSPPTGMPLNVPCLILRYFKIANLQMTKHTIKSIKQTHDKINRPDSRLGQMTNFIK